MTLDPKTKFYTAPNATPIAIRVAFVFSILLLLATFAVVYCSWGGQLGIVPLYLFIGFWAVGPPVWFWFEYFCVYRKYGERTRLSCLSMVKTYPRPSGQGFWPVS